MDLCHACKSEILTKLRSHVMDRWCFWLLDIRLVLKNWIHFWTLSQASREQGSFPICKEGWTVRQSMAVDNWNTVHLTWRKGWVGGIPPHSSRLGTLWLPNEAGRACNLGNGCWAGDCGPSLSRGLTPMKTTTKVMSAGILPSTYLKGNRADAIYLCDAPLLYPNPISIPFFPFRELRHNRSPGHCT